MFLFFIFLNFNLNHIWTYLCIVWCVLFNNTQFFYLLDKLNSWNECMQKRENLLVYKKWLNVFFLGLLGNQDYEIILSDGQVSMQGIIWKSKWKWLCDSVWLLEGSWRDAVNPQKVTAIAISRWQGHNL